MSLPREAIFNCDFSFSLFRRHAVCASLSKLFFVNFMKSKRRKGGINDKWIAITLHALTHAGGSKNKKISCAFLYADFGEKFSSSRAVKNCQNARSFPQLLISNVA
jgi:hypothetical protein